MIVFEYRNPDLEQELVGKGYRHKNEEKNPDVWCI